VSDDDDAVNSEESGAWIRLGALVRETRKTLGYRSFEAFADKCGFSARVASAIEAGERTNYSAQTLELLEAGLGWPRGTVERVVTEPDFDPATSTVQPGTSMLFRPPHFDPDPVPVPVEAVIEVCGALDQAAETVRAAEGAGTRAGTDDLRELAAAVLPVCWIHILRMVEQNCSPGEHLSPAARPSYDAFVKIQEMFSPPGDLSAYAQWLVGDRPDTDKTDRDRYHRRWADSVHPLPEGERRISAAGWLFRPLSGDDSPVMVDRDVIVRVIEVLTAIARAHGLGESTTRVDAARQDNPVLWSLAAASLLLCWPYITRTVEDNVIPGVEVNPAVGQQYTMFRDVAVFFAPDDGTALLYVRWLTGDIDDTSAQTRQRYLRRWNESRHKRRDRAAKRPS
jgi:hypothetical protein